MGYTTDSKGSRCSMGAYLPDSPEVSRDVHLPADDVHLPPENERDAAAKQRRSRYVDLASVILISLATALSAWCVYQSSRWATSSTELYNAASAFRVRAAEAKSRSSALEVADLTLFTQYLGAQYSGDTRYAHFLYTHFRPETQQAVHAWLAQHPLTNPAAAPSPFAMRQYRLHTDEVASHLTAEEETAFRSAREHNTTADSYVLLTVFMASASFLGGVGGKLQSPFHIVLITIGFALVIIASGAFLRLPAM
jgi:hypothetical protein